ncbi:MAG: hypothetical protein F6K17_17780 [Okeania sp. SIO3C4]|nr:hypothetical protein [Okeania sp. SIO3B3]NER04326.1 hypothetical protein [Okeania sp. SIO3C4]
MRPTKIHEYRKYFQSISISTDKIRKYGDLRCLNTWQRAYGDYQEEESLSKPEDVQDYFQQLVTIGENVATNLVMPLAQIELLERRLYSDKKKTLKFFKI